MSLSQVNLLPEKVSVSKISFGAVRDLGSGGVGAKQVPILYDGVRLAIQTPFMYVPYDVNEHRDVKKDKDGKDVAMVKYDLNLSFKGMDTDDKLKKLHDKLTEIENFVIEKALANVSTWFKGKTNLRTTDAIRAVFNPIVKLGLDKRTNEVKYPSTFKTKLPYDADKGEFLFKSYDVDRNEVNFSDIMGKLKGGKARVLVQLSGLWFTSAGFGCLWKLTQGQFVPHIEAPATFSFIDDEDEEEVRAKVKAGDVSDDDLANEALSAAKTVTMVDEEDEEAGEDADEEEAGEDAEEEAGEDVEEEVVEEPEPEPEPEPVPPPKKAVAKKATTAKK